MRVVHTNGSVYDFYDLKGYINIEEPKPKDINDRKKSEPTKNESSLMTWDGDIDKLAVSDRIKDLIVNGKDGTYSSRSEADQAVITALVHKGVGEYDIKAIFESYPDGIGEKYKDHSSPDDYLSHNISKAKEMSNLTPAEMIDPLFISGSISKDKNNRYQLNVVEFEEYIVEKFKLKYLEKEKAFFKYSGKSYEQCSDDYLNYLCQKELGKHRKRFTKSVMYNFIHFCIADDLVDSDKARNDQVIYLTLQNGLFDLIEETLISHTPEIFTTNLLPYQVRAMVHYNFQNDWGWLETIPSDVMENVEVFSADITDPFAVQKGVEGCELVFHLAALIAIPYSYLAPASYVETNVKGTLNVLEVCKNSGVRRLVHTSTSETYGTAQYVPIDEKHPLVGQSPYSASKISADKLAESYHLSFDLPVVTIRPFNTFGPRQSARAVIPTVIIQALSGADKINLGSLTPVRDLNYVKDTVAGFIAAANAEDALGKTINCGRGEGVTIGELARMILDICGSKAEIVTDEERVRPEKSEVMELICDNTLARELMGWEPKYSLQEGLEETVAWMRENLDRYKTNIYNV